MKFKKMYIVLLLIILSSCARMGENVPCIDSRSHQFGTWENSGINKWGYPYQTNKCLKCNYSIHSY